MAVNKLIFKDAEKARDAIMDSQKKEIAALYKKWADEVSGKADTYAKKLNSSAPVSEAQYRELKKQLKAASNVVSNEVKKKIQNNMYLTSDAVVKSNQKWLKSLGFESKLNVGVTSVQDDIIRRIITGQVYDSGWSLSKAIWTDEQRTLKDIYEIVAKGVAQNTPIYNIAKELQAYVDPSKRLEWNLIAKDGAKIYKRSVDYAAQRLARTLVQHSYQQTFIATTQKNPFINYYIWRSNGSRACPLCKARDGMAFRKDELPMDHPNGMCTMDCDVAPDMIDQLANWINSPDGSFPDIDEFAKNFGYF